MPAKTGGFYSDRQRRFIYAAASDGKAWARKFLKDHGHSVPKVRRKDAKKVRRK